MAPNGFINFEKIYLIGRTVQQIHLCQETPYNLAPVPVIQEYLDTFMLILKPRDIAAEAKKCEPPEELPGLSEASKRKTLTKGVSYPIILEIQWILKSQRKPLAL
jgi:hypothetical protein